MPNAALFYVADPTRGGWVTYTAHLAHALRLSGYTPMIYKIGKRDEGFTRDFGYDLRYTNVSIATAALIALGTPFSMTVVLAPKRLGEAEPLLAARIPLVVHDPTEMKSEVLQAIARNQTPLVALRTTNAARLLDLGLDATYCRPPYVPYFDGPLDASDPKLRRAVAFSRLDWDKNTDLIVKANASLPPGRRVALYGAVNAMYAHHRLPANWKRDYNGGFDPVWGAGARVSRTALYAVDLSTIAGDGDGMQFTFLEAWDAGSVLVVSRKWLVTGQDVVRDGHNALAVADDVELADLLRGPLPEGRAALIAAGRETLTQFAPAPAVAALRAVLSERAA